MSAMVKKSPWFLSSVPDVLYKFADWQLYFAVTAKGAVTFGDPYHLWECTSSWKTYWFLGSEKTLSEVAELEWNSPLSGDQNLQRLENEWVIDYYHQVKPAHPKPHSKKDTRSSSLF
jgi:hypothetical protein